MTGICHFKPPSLSSIGECVAGRPPCPGAGDASPGGGGQLRPAEGAGLPEAAAAAHGAGAGEGKEEDQGAGRCEYHAQSIDLSYVTLQ